MARQTPQVTLSTANEMAYRALRHGADSANLAGDCEEPRPLELRGVESLLSKQLDTIRRDPFVDWYYENGDVRYLPGQAPDPAAPPKVLTVVIKVRCRKCSKCLWHKRRQWTAKAIAEVRQSRRTWFGTLTVGPDRRLWARCSAEQWARSARCEAFGNMTPIERTRALAKFISPEVTRWLKRVRKNSGAPLRYLLVVEPHADGFPHYHLLLHETAQAVGKRKLEQAWTWGFSQFKLLDAEQVSGVRYACKYLTKAAQTRVRASRQYGQFREELGTELIEATRVIARKERPSPKKGENTRKALF